NSSPLMVADSSATSIVDRPCIGITLDEYPINEKRSVSLRLGTLSSYIPSASVVVPMVVPITEILTPGSGSSVVWSVTVPVTVVAFCAITLPEKRNIMHHIPVTIHLSKDGVVRKLTSIYLSLFIDVIVP